MKQNQELFGNYHFTQIWPLVWVRKFLLGEMLSEIRYGIKADGYAW